MADTITGKIEPSLQGGEGIYQFTLDGIATSKQMDKLLDLTKDLVKKLVGEGADSLKGVAKAADDAAEAMDDAAKSAKELEKSQDKLKEEQNKAANFLKNVWEKRFSYALDDSTKTLSLFSGAVGFVYTGLKEYNKSLSEGLKRGVGGSIFDLAIASKRAGVSLSTFNKALAESGGGFAGLGDSATDGAMEFGYLTKSVRQATSSVGNLGMSNDELAMLTAQQVKTAIGQGFKGRQAQEVVIRNTKMLGAELDNLASRTGKSVLELAQAAAKLAQDPLVSNFVKTAQAGGKEVSLAVQSFASSMKGVFGETGEAMAKDILQSSLSGLPLIVTKTGKDMILASNGIYNEFERLGAKVKNGQQVSEEDRQRLRELAQKEVKERGAQLRQFAMLGGSVGESANAILKMAQEAEFYNSEEGKRQRRQSEAAKQFNAELNKLQASLQEAMIPFLHAINAVDWGTVFKVVSYIPMKIAEVIQGITGIFDKIFGGDTGMIGDILSKILGLGVGFVTTLGLVATAYVIYQKSLGAVTTLLGSLGIEVTGQTSKFGLANKALDAFIASLYKAAASADGKTPIGGGGIPDMPDKKPGTPAEKPKEKPRYKMDPKTGKPVLIEPKTPTTGPATPPPVSPSNTKAPMSARLMKGLGWGSVIGAGAEMTAEAIGKDTTAGKATSVLGSALSFGSMGAMAGPWGMAGGAIAGAALGIWQNFFKDDDNFTGMSDEVKKAKMTAAEKDEANIKQQIEQNKKMLDEMRALREETGYGNQISARGVSYQASSDRQLSNLRYTQQ